MLLTVAILLSFAAIFLTAPQWLSIGSAPDLFAAGSTATPTRTPKPTEDRPPTATPLALSIVMPTATPQPAAEPPVGKAEPEKTLPDWLLQITERYGMDPARRFIVVDLASQQMFVWKPGEELRMMAVSTGDETRGYRTLKWHGLVGRYVGTFQASGVYADDAWYLFEDAGQILIHSSPYRLIDGKKVYEELDALGSYPASKGCIRLAPENAAWLTSWDPEGVPIVILPKEEGDAAG